MTRTTDTEAASTLEVVIFTARSAAPSESLHEAWALLQAADGYRGHHLGPCVEEPDRYMLMIWWRRIEDHVHTFRQSAGYARWKELLNTLIEPDPYVRHFTIPRS